MLKRNITYEDFDGNTVTEVFYFNLSKTEIVELEVEYEGGLEKSIQRIIEAKDYEVLIREFQRLILLSYGVKSEDGKRFVKSDQLREEFKQTAAYDALFVELAADENAAADFFIGVVPKDLADGVRTELAATTLPTDSTGAMVTAFPPPPTNPL
jgi:hypothetical protein